MLLDPDLIERLAKKIVVDQETGCWYFDCQWESGNGYKKVSIAGRAWMAHRAVYEVLVGPIPEGHVLDHLCRDRGCCNPYHLEPVTQAENVRRGEAVLFEAT